jgi:hypothetical protein
MIPKHYDLYVPQWVQTDWLWHALGLKSETGAKGKFDGKEIGASSTVEKNDNEGFFLPKVPQKALFAFKGFKSNRPKILPMEAETKEGDLLSPRRSRERPSPPLWISPQPSGSSAVKRYDSTTMKALFWKSPRIQTFFFF